MQNNLGSALLLVGEWKEAEEVFRRAVALQPREASYHINLGFALYRQGEGEAARREYRRSLELAPGWPRAYLRDAWVMAAHPDAQQRNGALAVQTVEKVLLVEGEENPAVLDALAAAHAEAGQWSKAVETARRGLARARAADRKELANELAGRLALYEQSKPFRNAGLR
jgi:Flp pilus assembly protein TadD